MAWQQQQPSSSRRNWALEGLLAAIQDGTCGFTSGRNASQDSPRSCHQTGCTLGPDLGGLGHVPRQCSVKTAFPLQPPCTLRSLCAQPVTTLRPEGCPSISAWRGGNVSHCWSSPGDLPQQTLYVLGRFFLGHLWNCRWEADAKARELRD